MAKLSGVQTVDMVGGEVTKIAYDGAEYAKVADGVPKVGDIGLFISSDFAYGGEFTEIEGIDREGDPIVCREHSVNWYAENLEYFRKHPVDSPTTTDRLDSLETRVTALEEPEEAKPNFSVGDYAKVVGITCFDDIHEGTIVKVAVICKDGDYKIELLDGSDYDLANADSLEKVSEEDAKKAEAHAKKVAKFASIGRKVDEYKVGDIVSTRFYGIIEILEFNEGDEYPIKFIKDGRRDSLKLAAVKLITPVERRFDK